MEPFDKRALEGLIFSYRCWLEDTHKSNDDERLLLTHTLLALEMLHEMLFPGPEGKKLAAKERLRRRLRAEAEARRRDAKKLTKETTR